MKIITLDFEDIKECQPSSEKDCYCFLLKFRNTYAVANWGAEKEMFFYEDSGDYIADTNFLWAELPQ